MPKEMKMSEVLTEDNIRILAEKVSYLTAETEKMSENNYFTVISKVRNKNESQLLLKMRKEILPYISRNCRHIGNDRTLEIHKFINKSLSDTCDNRLNAKDYLQVVKALGTWFNAEAGYFNYSTFSAIDLRSFYSGHSVFLSFPKKARRAIRDFSWASISQRNWIKRLAPQIIGSVLNVEISEMDDYEYEDWLQKVDSISSQEIGSMANTNNPIIWGGYDDSYFKVARGIVLIHHFVNSGFMKTSWELRRNIQRQRQNYSNWKREKTERAFSTITDATKRLFEFAPRGWESNPNIPAICKLLAERKYPKGSLSAVEIEFVGTSDSPLHPGEPDYENCGECDGCNAMCEGNEDAECESPNQITNDDENGEWLNHPTIQFTTDSSVASTRPNQVRLNYQEVRCIQNIKDSKPLELLTNWMKANKIEVNKTCGLHVHLDTRDLTARKYTIKSRKAELAVKNWMQFCVPFSRFEGHFCQVYSSNRWDRYRAVNVTAREKHNTMEFRLGSASTNYDKIWNWIQLCHWVVRGKGDNTTLNGFLASDASPELKAFVIARICRFYRSHVEGRKKPIEGESVHGTMRLYKDPAHEANIISNDIHQVFKIWGTVGLDELGG